MAEKEWFVWEKIPRLHPLMVFDFVEHMSSFPEPALPVPTGAMFENHRVYLVSVEKDFKNSGLKAAEEAMSNPEWLLDNLNEIEKTSEDYLKILSEFKEHDFSGFSNKQLAKIFSEIHSRYAALHRTGILSVVMEFTDEFLSSKIREFIEKKISSKKLDLEAGKVFSVLSQPVKESSLARERKDFLVLLELADKNKKIAELCRKKPVEQILKELPALFPEFDALLEKHWSRHQWIFFMYEGPVLKKDYFVGQLKERLDDAAEIKKERLHNQRIVSLQKKLIQKLASNEKERQILSFPRLLVETKSSRKDAMYYGCFLRDFLYREIAKRLGIPMKQVRFMTPEEIADALEGEFSDFAFLEERAKCFVFYAINGKKHFLAGEDARKWFDANVKIEKSEGISLLKGTSAFPGQASGLVRVINHPNEMNKMNKGDIMVSHATSPDLLPAMGKAAAIVTDVGGLTCHAAIVSREFQIPCVVGTKIATQVLKDNDLVEVDATNGIVRKKEK